MEANEQTRFDSLYAQHLRALKLRGYSASTIDVYARAVRRLTDYFDCIPDQLSVEQLEVYFAELVDTRSWGNGACRQEWIAVLLEVHSETGLALGGDY